MSNHRKGRFEFKVHTEIVDWIIRLVNEKCWSGPHIQPKPNNGHFNTTVEMEIEGDEAQLDEAINFIQNTSEITSFKMPWLNDFTYYVKSLEEKERVEEQLKIMKETNYALKYKCTTISIIRSLFYLFHFRSGLDDDEKLKIDEIFRIKNENSIFLPYPHKMANQTQSAFDIHILTAFHGKFLEYLDLEDILSLEMANTRCNNLFWDKDLDNDIQKYLQKIYSVYYTGEKKYSLNLRECRSAELIRLLIKKFHTSIKECSISNILTADEIQTLSHLYNIKFHYHDIIHIDFKGMNEKVNFCAIHHYEPIPMAFLYYGSKYATENYSVDFNEDGSLDSRTNRTEFSGLFIKSNTNSSPLQTNAVLKYVAKNFMVGQFPNNVLSKLTLYEFDLNLVPTNIFRSLMSMMREGHLVFEKVNFNLNTLNAILGQSDGNRIELRRCQINVTNNMEEFPCHSKTRDLRFCDMDLELSAITILKNVELLDIFDCRIHNNFPKLERPPNEIKQCANELIQMSSCSFFLGDSDESCYFIVGRYLWIRNSEIKLKTIFQILQNCEIQNYITFDNCHLLFEHEQFEHFSPKPVQLVFKNATVDTSAMHTILGKLSNKSNVYFEDCYIFPIDEFIDAAANATIRIEYIHFEKCTLEMQTLLNILGKMSSTAAIHIENCNLLLNLDLMHRNSLVRLSILGFHDMCLDSKHLMALLNILDQNSHIQFSRCEIANPCTEQYNFKQELKITIGLINMSVDLQMFIFKQKKWNVYLKNCQLKFHTDLIPNILIESSIIVFENITFDSANHFKLFANFSETSTMVFKNCDFGFTSLHLMPDIMIKPRKIYFKIQSFDLEVLVTILERISDETTVVFIKCDVKLVREVFSIRPITIKSTYFEKMQLDVAIFLRIAKNFGSICGIQFKSCKFVCTKPHELPNITLHLANVTFADMEFDVNLFKIIVQKFTETVGVLVENCNFTTVPEEMLSKESVNLRRIVFHNVDYSPGVLQCLQQLNNECLVIYDGELTNRALIDICFKTSIHGDRLWLISNTVTRSVYFELFAEYFQVLSQQLDFETEYDLPTYLIPYPKPVDVRYSFDEFKVKLVSVNDVTVKLEFLRFGEPIDLFYLLNDLPEDSDDEFIIDHS